MPRSPEQRQLRRLHQGRARWKQRATAKQRTIRQLRTTVRDLSASRDLWKQRCRTLQRQHPGTPASDPTPVLLALPTPAPATAPLTVPGL
jgi:hypothetical protein